MHELLAVISGSFAPPAGPGVLVNTGYPTYFVTASVF